MTRTLVLVRHATAEPFADSDHERSLSARGRREAAQVGQRLNEAGITPEVVLVSSALRTQQTCDLVLDSAGWALTPWVDTTLYDGGPHTVLELLHALPEETGTAVLVGHNPTIALMAQLLDDGEGTPLVEVHPGTAIIIDLDVAWADLDSALGRIRTILA